jgi:hypothetical protein
VPPRCKFFIWLDSLNRFWTVDRLARRSLEHPKHCMLCDQEDEMMQHILVNCVLSREVWFRVLALVGLQHCTSNPTSTLFQEWWRTATQMVPKQHRSGFHSLVILVAWWLWKHRNVCVFEKASPSVQKVIQDIKEDARLWCLAGAKGLSRLWPQLP